MQGLQLPPRFALSRITGMYENSGCQIGQKCTRNYSGGDHGWGVAGMGDGNSRRQIGRTITRNYIDEFRILIALV